MKILEIIPQLSSGGAERLVVDLCNELSQFHEVTLLLYYNLSDYNFYANEISERVNVISLNKKKGLDLRLFSQVSLIFNSIKPDVVHMHLHAINYVLPRILKSSCAKFFMTIHNDAKKECEGWIGEMIRRFCFKSNKIIPIAISDESLKSFRKLYGFDAELIYNGRKINFEFLQDVDVLNEVTEYKHSLKTKVIINLARFSPVKRQPLIAKVSARLEAEGYDFILLMIGRTDDDFILQEVEQYNTSSIKILGEKSNPLQYLKQADAFCLASTYEGLPISLIEALGVGVLPICTPVGGIVNIIKDGYNGYLAEDLSEESFYKLVKRFLETDKDDCVKMKNNALHSYGTYSIEKCASKHVALFIKS